MVTAKQAVSIAPNRLGAAWPFVNTRIASGTSQGKRLPGASPPRFRIIETRVVKSFDCFRAYIRTEDARLGQVISENDLISRRAGWREGGRRVVLASGSFDLLHPGHVRLLEQARSYGHIMVVAVLDDASVRARSISLPGGGERPVYPSNERAEVLAAVAAVDFVVECSSDGLPALISRLQPEVLIEGSQPSSSGSLTAAASKTSRTDVVRIPIEPGHSTARLIDRIKQLRA